MSTPGPPPDSAPERYARQTLFAGIGPEGQKRLGHARVTLVGCGALGTHLADILVRAGVGALRVIDRDYIELDNLQRQALFDEHDLAAGLPKAEAAARKLRRINSAVEVEGLVADVNPGNAESLCAEADLLLDGSDNFETRYLINDVAVKHSLPWVYGACIGAEGLVMPILPRDTPCLRCIWDEPPPPGSTPTCDTAGILAPAAAVVASLQALEAMKILTGRLHELTRGLTTVELWRLRVHTLDVQSAREQGDCPCCKHGRYDYLGSDRASTSITLCGREAVQVAPPPGATCDLAEVARRLPAGARPSLNPFLLRFQVGGLVVTLFPDGRAIIKGTSDPTVARATYARYVGL